MEKQETIADIIAAMRRGTRLPGYWRSCDVNEILQYHADRLEAAWKREKAAIEADALAAGGLVEASRATAEKSSVVGDAAAKREAVTASHGLGDAAKMREALKTVKRYFDGYTVNILELRRKVDAALAAPLRNCDRFRDAEAARQAWLDDKENWDEFGSPKLELHEWLFALATEQKGENDGR